MPLVSYRASVEAVSARDPRSRRPETVRQTGSHAITLGEALSSAFLETATQLYDGRGSDEHRRVGPDDHADDERKRKASENLSAEEDRKSVV